MRACGRAADHARDLGARHVRQLRTVLIEAAGLQRVGERHTGGVYVDDHRIGIGRLVDLDQLRGSGTVEPGNLYGAHGAPSVDSSPQAI